MVSQHVPELEIVHQEPCSSKVPSSPREALRAVRRARRLLDDIGRHVLALPEDDLPIETIGSIVQAVCRIETELGAIRSDSHQVVDMAKGSAKAARFVVLGLKDYVFGETRADQQLGYQRAMVQIVECMWRLDELRRDLRRLHSSA